MLYCFVYYISRYLVERLLLKSTNNEYHMFKISAMAYTFTIPLQMLSNSIEQACLLRLLVFEVFASLKFVLRLFKSCRWSCIRDKAQWTMHVRNFNHVLHSYYSFAKTSNTPLTVNVLHTRFQTLHSCWNIQE